MSCKERCNLRSPASKPAGFFRGSESLLFDINGTFYGPGLWEPSSAFFLAPAPILRPEQDSPSPNRQPASPDPCKACSCCNREERGFQSRDWVELERRREAWSGSPCRHCRCIRILHQNHSHWNTDLSPCPFLNTHYRRRNSGTRLIAHSDSWHCWDTHRCRCSSTSSGNCRRGHASPVHLRRTIPF